MSDITSTPEDRDALEPSRIVTLTGGESEPLPCEVIFEVPENGVTYALLTPAEPVVVVLREDASDEEAPLESIETSEFPEVEKYIQAALGEFDLQISVKGDEFILVGEMSEALYEQADLMEVDDEGEKSEYLIIREVDDAAHHYLIALPMEPPLYAGQIVSETEATRLSDEEFGRVEGLFSEVLLEWASEQGEEGDED
jgi:hypothetical protein